MLDQPSSRRVLVVEDEPLIRAAIAEELSERGFQVLEARDTSSALATLESQPGITAVVSDIKMPGALDGEDLALTVQSRYPDVRMLVLSAHEPTPVLISAADGIIAKPTPPSTVADRLKAIMDPVS